MTGVQEIIIFCLCLLLSAFFSGAEAAILSIPSKKIKQLMEAGGSRAKSLEFLISKPNEVLTTLLVGNNFVNILAASISTLITQRYFDNSGLSIAVGVTTLLILLFGEILPKTLARNHGEVLVYPVMRILQVVYVVLFPVIRLLVFVIHKILGKNAQMIDKIVTKDDIEFLVNEAEKERSIDSKQIDLLTSILEFPTIRVRDIMTARGNVHAISKNITYEEVSALVRDVEHSRYPVYDQDLDETIGILHIKNLMFLTDEEKQNFDVTEFLNDPFFIYEHMKIQAVFDHMNRNKVHLAMVKDENATVVGIVTLEDIMEEIFGEIQDEYDDEEDGVPEAETDPFDGSITLPATISLRDLYNEYDIKIPLNDNYSTLAGFILEMLGNNFPSEGNILFWEGYRFTLIKVEDQEVVDVKIESSDGEKHIINRSSEEKAGEPVTAK